MPDTPPLQGLSPYRDHLFLLIHHRSDRLADAADEPLLTTAQTAGPPLTDRTGGLSQAFSNLHAVPTGPVTEEANRFIPVRYF
jgi:hypothetical protein